MRRLTRDISSAGINPLRAKALGTVILERSSLSRRLAYLERTKALFNAWHVFHQPLVWVMFGIVAIHMALAIYLGYSLF